MSAATPAFMFSRVTSLTTTGKVVHAIIRVPFIRDLIEPGSRYSLTDPTVRMPALPNTAPAPRVRRPRGPSYASMLKIYARAPATAPCSAASSRRGCAGLV